MGVATVMGCDSGPHSTDRQTVGRSRGDRGWEMKQTEEDQGKVKEKERTGLRERMKWRKKEGEGEKKEDWDKWE